MTIFRGTTTDGKFIIGLEAENIESLKNGEPIVFRLPQIGGHDTVILMYADSFKKLEAVLEQLNGAPLPMNPWPETQ